MERTRRSRELTEKEEAKLHIKLKSNERVKQIVLTAFKKEFIKLSILKRSILFESACGRVMSATLDILFEVLHHKYSKDEIWEAIEELFDLQIPIPKTNGLKIGWQPLQGIIYEDEKCDLIVSPYIQDWLDEERGELVRRRFL